MPPDTTDALPFAQWQEVWIAGGVVVALILMSAAHDLVSRRFRRGSASDFQSGSADTRMEFSNGGGCLCVPGALFAGVGTFVLLTYSSDTHLFGKIITILLGGSFLAAGAGLAGWRSSIVLDKPTQRTIDQKSWLFIPLRRRTYPFDHAVCVRIEKTKDEVEKPYVTLRCGDSAELFLNFGAYYQDAKQQADSVARFLDIPLQDKFDGVVKIREVEPDGPSIGEQESARSGLPSGNAKQGHGDSLPAPPSDRIVVEKSDGRLVVQLPLAPTYRPGISISVMIVAALAGSGVAKMADGNWMLGGAAALAIMALAFLFSWLAYRLRTSRRERIVVTGEELRVEERTLLRRRSGSLKVARINQLELIETRDDPAQVAAEIKALRGLGKFGGWLAKREAKVQNYAEMIYRTRDPLRARSDRGTLKFGRGLTPEEADWLRQVLVKAVSE